MEPIISTRGLSKSYQIRSGQKKRYSTLRDDLSDFAQGLLKGKIWRSRTEDFWALKDVNLDIYPGEVVGIIGRNGAGKSTLLKILSRVVQPTSGEATLQGRVASLLEVGTGFHPELTGRENIFISGAVLGMKRIEIKQKFDEIVAFAEVEKFLDMPVKRYSSGMYMRLAFAVAAHLEADILLVDEVLAVGDAGFQKKCLGKIENLTSAEGRTVLFVSHNMAAIQGLCNEAVLLERGQVLQKGRPALAIEQYLSELARENSNSGEIFLQPDTAQLIRSIRIKNHQGEITSDLLMGEAMVTEIEVVESSKYPDLVAGVTIENIEGIKVFAFHSAMTATTLMRSNNVLTIKCFIQELRLTPGKYWLTISLVRGLFEYLERLERVMEFTVLDADVYGTGFLVSRDYGVTYVNGTWESFDNQGGMKN
jgi:lipopolysaccharide transport system ATP-binding protein